MTASSTAVASSLSRLSVCLRLPAPPPPLLPPAGLMPHARPAGPSCPPVHCPPVLHPQDPTHTADSMPHLPPVRPPPSLWRTQCPSYLVPYPRPARPHARPTGLGPGPPHTGRAPHLHAALLTVLHRTEHHVFCAGRACASFTTTMFLCGVGLRPASRPRCLCGVRTRPASRPRCFCGAGMRPASRPRSCYCGLRSSVIGLGPGPAG